MKHQDKVDHVKVTVIFNAYGHKAYVESIVSLEMLSDPLLVRMGIDEQIEHFFLTTPDPRKKT